jgi:hypothetical protein
MDRGIAHLWSLAPAVMRSRSPTVRQRGYRYDVFNATAGLYHGTPESATPGELRLPRSLYEQICQHSILRSVQHQ